MLEQLEMFPVCEECGDDLAVEGHIYCLDCLEVLDDYRIWEEWDELAQQG